MQRRESREEGELGVRSQEERESGGGKYEVGSREGRKVGS
jgi:hypothetical protein